MQRYRINAFVIVCAAAGVLCGTAGASVLADSVNDSFAADNNNYWGANDVGWFYTPTSSYNLSGINTYFSIPNGTIIQNRTVTAVVYQGNTPANGGTLLGSFAFDSSLAEGHLGGGSFASPIALTGGQTYFVGFEDVGPLSPTPNVDDIGVNFTASNSATFLSNLFFDNSVSAGCTTAHSFQCNDPNHDILGQPILQFFEPSPVSGAPEPGSFELLGGALLVGFRLLRRPKQRV